MHKTATVPLLSKVHRAEFCTDRIFSHFLQSNVFPGYIHGFTFGIKLVITFLRDVWVKTRIKCLKVLVWRYSIIMI